MALVATPPLVPRTHDLRRELEVTGAIRTDVGLVRTRNEDAGHVDPRGRFVVIADGMGGHDGGDVASALAVELVRGALEDPAAELDALAAGDARDAIRALLDDTIARVNRAVLAAGAAAGREGMGTTLDVVVIAGGSAHIAHVGDGRAYLIRHGRALQLTTDHTVVASLVRAGMMSEAEAEVSPLRSALAAAIGAGPDVAPEHVEVPLRPGDRLLLATDGLYDYFTGDDLALHLATGDVELALDELVDLAKRRGGHDNLTGIALEVDGALDAHDVVELLAPLRDEDITRPRGLAVDPEA